jgi:hypothetical protein
VIDLSAASLVLISCSAEFIVKFCSAESCLQMICDCRLSQTHTFSLLFRVSFEFRERSSMSTWLLSLLPLLHLDRQRKYRYTRQSSRQRSLWICWLSDPTIVMVKRPSKSEHHLYQDIGNSWSISQSIVDISASLVSEKVSVFLSWVHFNICFLVFFWWLLVCVDWHIRDMRTIHVFVLLIRLKNFF